MLQPKGLQLVSRGDFRGEKCCVLEIQFRVHTEQQPIFKKQKEQKAFHCYHKNESLLGEQEPWGTRAPDTVMQQSLFTLAENLTPAFSTCFTYLVITFIHQNSSAFPVHRVSQLLYSSQSALQFKPGQDYKESGMCHGNGSASLKLELNLFTAGMNSWQMHKTDSYHSHIVGDLCASTNFLAKCWVFPVNRFYRKVSSLNPNCCISTVSSRMDNIIVHHTFLRCIDMRVLQN